MLANKERRCYWLTDSCCSSAVHVQSECTDTAVGLVAHSNNLCTPCFVCKPLLKPALGVLLPSAYNAAVHALTNAASIIITDVRRTPRAVNVLALPPHRSARHMLQLLIRRSHRVTTCRADSTYTRRLNIHIPAVTTVVVQK